MERILGIDFGDRRVGLAVSDLLGITAQPIGFIVIDGANDAVFKIAPYIKEYDIKKIVLGLPKNMNGDEGERAEKTRRFGEKLKSAFDIEVHYFDERLTTVYADHTLNALNVKGKKKTGKKDALSAVLILQGYMGI